MVDTSGVFGGGVLRPHPMAIIVSSPFNALYSSRLTRHLVAKVDVTTKPKVKVKRQSINVNNPAWNSLMQATDLRCDEYPLSGFPNLFLKKGSGSLTLVCRFSFKGKRYTETVGAFNGSNAIQLVSEAHRRMERIKAGLEHRKVSFRQFYERHLAEINRKLRSVDAIKSKDNRLLAAFGELALSEMKPLHIEAYFGGMQTKPGTKNRILSRLKVILDTAVRLKYLESSPAADFVQEHEPQNPYPVMSEQEAEQFVEYAKRDSNRVSADALLLMFFTGLRAGNIISLRRNQIDLAQRTMTIPKAKNGRYQVFPLNARAMEVIQARMAQSNSEYLFPSDRTKTGFIGHPTDVMKRISELMRKDGVLAHHIVIHSLRATAATIWYKKSKDLVKVGRLLGHSTLVSTERYTRTNVDDLREVSDLIN